MAGQCHGPVACVQGPELGLMFHFPSLETFNNFLTKGLAFTLHWASPEWWYGAWVRDGKVTFLLR